MRAGAALVLTAAVAALACSPGPRDVAGENRDVRVVAGEADAGPGDAYAHVARRPRAVVALAESRHMRADEARAFTERLADDVEACASRLEERGELVDGAARIVAIAGPRGTAEGLNVRLAPGGAVAQNALLCLLAPLRALPFPPSTDGQQGGLALEVTWQPTGADRARSGKVQSGGYGADGGPPPP